MAFSKIQVAIVGVLGLLGQRVHRTKLVKLVYLVDNRFYELNGTTLTGLTYMWDNYGPNAVSNAIVGEVTSLVRSNRVHMLAQPSAYGTDSYLYWVPESSIEEALAVLSPGEVQVLRDVVKKYGRMGVQRIVAAAKRTKPFEQAKQYEVLSLQTSPQAKDLQARVTANTSLMDATRKGLADLEKGRLISQEDLDHLYSQRV